MASNPINLVLRFLLELAMLASLGVWAWSRHEGVARYALVVLVPLVAATLWGVFRVPNDGGPPTVEVPGIVRLALEFALFGAAVVALVMAQRPRLALVLGVVTLVHYA